MVCFHHSVCRMRTHGNDRIQGISFFHFTNNFVRVQRKNTRTDNKYLICLFWGVYFLNSAQCLSWQTDMPMNLYTLVFKPFPLDCKTSWRWKTFCVTYNLWRVLALAYTPHEVTLMRHRCLPGSYSEEAFEQTVESSVVWDNILIMCPHHYA